MKLLFSVLVLSLLISCKKKSDSVYFTGQSDNMMVRYVNESIKAEPSEDFSIEELEIDLDSDGSTDIIFTSTVDSIHFPKGDYWEVGLKIENDDFSIYEIPGSGISYEVLSSDSFDYYGTYPRRTKYLRRKCVQEYGDVEIQNYNTPYALYYDIPFEFETYNWENQFPEMLLSNSYYIEEQYEFNETFDSLVGVSINHEPTCFAVPSEEIFYLAFRKAHTAGEYDIGWIEVEISERNRISVRRIGISTSVESF